MKKLLLFSATLSLLVISSCIPPQQEVPPDESEVTYQEFYDDLSPYGHWVQHPTLGYIWIPEAGPDFVPYSSGGYWVWTDAYGWTWTSDYSWGWAPFHYGRWDYADEYGGWYWVPEYTWGPAWVSWRQCAGYYGWAPLRPGISVEFAMGGRYDPDDRWWTACDERYMGGRDMRDHFEHGGQDRGNPDHGVIGRIRGGESHVIGNAPDVGGGKRGFVTGPARQDVEAVTHQSVQPVKLVTSNKPGEALSNGTLSLYRPQAQRVTSQPVQTRSQQTPQQQQQPHATAPQTTTEPRQSRNTQPQSSPSSVTTPRDIQDLHRQANPNFGRPQNNPQPAPRQQQPMQQRQQQPPPQRQPQPAPHQQAPRGNQGQHEGGGGKPK
jgi:hypothetical protein